jgi:hypothetical protein
MPHCTPHRHQRQLHAHLEAAQQAPGLPFAQWLPTEVVTEALQEADASDRDCLYTPLVTLHVFLGQLFDPDHSCRQAVARFLAWRLANGDAPCATDTGAYCKARQRLPEAALHHLVQRTGGDLHDQALPDWCWHGRPVKVVDGTTVSMPDTPANQEAYPQSRSQRPGLGFPLARVVVVFSLAVGTVLDAAIGRYAGKQQGEPALFRSLHDGLEPNDILLADRYYCSYWEVAWAQQRGIDVVLRLHQRRPVRGRRGATDYTETWTRPPRPDWMDAADYAALPETLTLRIVLVEVAVAGFRTRHLWLATSLRDAAAFPADDLAALYRARWQAELNLRSLKQTLQMDVLRCKSPELVRKELWGHLLVYNLIRTVMARAAEAHEVLPRELSFKGTLQTLNAFEETLRHAAATERDQLYAALLGAIAQHRVGDRPNRYEPRACKRRPKPHPLLTVPRSEAKARLATTT